MLRVRSSRREPLPVRRTSRPRRPSVSGLEGRVAEAKLQLGTALCARRMTASSPSGSSMRGRTSLRTMPVVRFQNIDEIDIVVGRAGDVHSRRHSFVRPFSQVSRSFSMAPGRQFPVKLRRSTQVADPKTQTFEVRFAMKAPAGIHSASWHDGHRYHRLPSGRSVRATASLCPSLPYPSRKQGSKWRGSSDPDQTVSRRPVKMGARYGRPDRNRRRAATRRSHRGGGSGLPARRDEGSRSGRRTRRRPIMNPGVLSVKHIRIVFASDCLSSLWAGSVAYQNLGRLEDPEFTIKQALIVTPYPGASAEEVAQGGHQPHRKRLSADGPG